MHSCKFAASRLSAVWHLHCGLNVSYPWLNDWTHLQWALHRSCAAASSTQSSQVHSLHEGGYAAVHQLFSWYWSDRT